MKSQNPQTNELKSKLNLDQNQKFGHQRVIAVKISSKLFHRFFVRSFYQGPIS